ncbi:MAG: HAD-IC family P-type ATPase [Anaerolineae bacterium]|nr:HAD-IC family P-type ATPase [Anaerolineae bacterium]
MTLLGLVTFTDELRPHLKHTLEQFIQNGINIKVISGDNPQTVAALARQAGLTGDLSFVSGPELTGMSEAEFRQAALENTIFGRITPDQKEPLVEALRVQGHYVAMIGDGVNDVLSLKKADMGIAMESGSSATRSVADMVLLGDSFEALPAAFNEGQRIINGMKDILRLFMTRVLYSTLLIIGISIIDLGFPIEPKHNLLIVFLSVAVPTLALALWSRPGVLSQRSMLREIAHFVIPAAVSIFVLGMFIYVLAFAFATLNTIEMSPENVAAYTTYVGINYDIAGPDHFAIEVATLFAQSALTTFLIWAGLLLVIFVEPPISWFTGGDDLSGDWRPTLIALVMFLVFGLIVVVEPLRSFFELQELGLDGYGLVALITAVWVLILRLAWRANWMERLLDLRVSVSR